MSGWGSGIPARSAHHGCQLQEQSGGYSGHDPEWSHSQQVKQDDRIPYQGNKNYTFFSKKTIIRNSSCKEMKEIDSVYALRHCTFFKFQPNPSRV